MQCGADACVKTYNASRMRNFYAQHKDTTGQTYNARYYADRTTARAARPTNRARWPASAAAADQARRARKLGADAEVFSSTEVFERDAWVCGICSQPVDQALRYPDPMSASLDHVVPLSKGGAHTRDNTRCSHLSCNVRRGNREPDPVG